MGNNTSGQTDTTVPWLFGQKARRIQQLFHLSKDDVHQYIVRKPLNNEVQVQSTQDSVYCYSTCSIAQTLKKPCTKKNKEEAAKLLAKRMKQAKDKHQEQIAKTRRLFLLRASASESSQN